MIVFLWDQRKRRVESRELLKRAVLQYAEWRKNTDEFRESRRGSLFAFEPVAEQIQIRTTPEGKPYVTDPDGNRLSMEVSVTHTGDWWICAVGEHPLGIDAEYRNRQIRPELSRRICTEEEKAFLDCIGSVDKEGCRKHLLRIWIEKEAYVKYLGTGIREGLNTFSTFHHLEHCRIALLGELSREAGKMQCLIYCPEEEIEGYRWISM